MPTKQDMARLGENKGDALYLTQAPGGGRRPTPKGSEFACQMEVAEGIMLDDREVLRHPGEVSAGSDSPLRRIDECVVFHP